VASEYRIDRLTPGVFAELVLHRGNLVLEVGSRLDVPERSAVQWSPRLGVRYRLGGSSTWLRATMGRAFKLPSFFALASPPELGGNPDLRPERMIGGDLGIEGWVERAHLMVGLGLFANRYDDLIDFDFDTFSHVNRSEVEAVGAELTLDWLPAHPVEVHANLTWQEVEDRSSDQPLLHHPRWIGALRLQWTPDPRLRLELSGRAVSRSFDRQIPVPERDATAGHMVLSLAGSWGFADRWELRGRVENLTDRSYEAQIGFPGPGRSLRLGLRFVARGTRGTPRLRTGGVGR
jgi:vitamin B12 transporter